MLLAGGTALAQVVVFVSYPLLSRLYTPEDFGVLAVYAALLGVTLPVASFRYEYAIPIARNDGAARNLLTLCLSILLVNSVALTLLWLLARAFSWTTGSVGDYLWLLPLGFLAAGAYQAVSYWAIRQRDFPRLAKTKVGQGIGTAVTQIGLGFFSGPLGLLVGDVVGRSAGVLTLARPLVATRPSRTGRVTSPRLRAVARTYRRFPMYSSGSSLINALGLQAPALFMVAEYGVAAGGAFGLTLRVLSAPMALVGRAIMQVFFAEGAQLQRRDPAEVVGLFDRLAIRLLAMATIAATAIILVARPLFPTIFGSAWVTAGVYAQALGLMAGAQLLVVPLSHTLNLIERQDAQFLWDGLRLAALLCVFLAAHRLGWSDVTSVWAMSLTMTFAYLFLLALSRHLLRIQERAV